MDCSPPGTSVHGISQARILEWVAISFSRGSSQSRDQTCVSCIGRWFFTTEPPRKLLNVFTSGQPQIIFSFRTLQGSQWEPPLILGWWPRPIHCTSSLPNHRGVRFPLCNHYTCEGLKWFYNQSILKESNGLRLHKVLQRAYRGFLNFTVNIASSEENKWMFLKIKPLNGNLYVFDC